MQIFRFFTALLLLWSMPASARWLEASSDHFVIYGDQGQKSVTRFAERLERFHAAMAYRFKIANVKPSPSNRVTIYVVSDTTKVRKLVDDGNKFLGGVYIPRAGATMAVVPKLKSGGRQNDISEITLFHEYAHHFMYGITARSFPRWFSEGFAEFFAGVRFEKDGGVGLGVPAYHRAYELSNSIEVPIRTMLAPAGGAKKEQKRYNAFYGQSWLLFHYLMFSPDRKGQMAEYQNLLAKGETALDAATGAFGDLDQLEKDMDAYRRKRRISYQVIKKESLKTGPITVRTLTDGEADMMPIIMRSRRGVTSEEALELLPDARAVANKYPDDPAVLAALAEAEFDAENVEAAIAAADRALAVNPQNIKAQIQKIYALRRKVEDDMLPDEAWKDVRKQVVVANRLENDNPIPLIEYYQSYLQSDIPPPKIAVDGLERAMELAPFDGNLRWMVVSQMINDERFADAARTLGPLANSPHKNGQTEMAATLLEKVEEQAAAQQGSATE